jgi:hypothetical protein
MGNHGGSPATAGISFRTLNRSYIPHVFAGRITVFRLTWLPRGRDYNATMGWDSLAADGVELYQVAGYHNALLFAPRVGGLGKTLQRCLTAAHTAILTETSSRDLEV